MMMDYLVTVGQAGSPSNMIVERSNLCSVRITEDIWGMSLPYREAKKLRSALAKAAKLVKFHLYNRASATVDGVEYKLDHTPKMVANENVAG